MFTAKEYLIHHEIYDQLVNDISYKNAGVYKLRCFIDDKNYQVISRLLDQDIDGVLYIGSSRDCLVTRILNLRKSLCAAAGNYNGFKDPNAHQCGMKYSQTIQAKFPFQKLSVTVYPVPQDFNGDAEDVEITELRKYEKKFGELPPFNDVHPKARWHPHEQI